jgi:hypothetical protein
MSAWLRSPYRSIGIYIGGANRACGDGNLSATWVSTVEAQGWNLAPLYVGLQAPCVTQGGLATIDPGLAGVEGTQAADDAVARAAHFGLRPGNPIYFDMEGYGRIASCIQTVQTFVSSWTAELHRQGYGSGVYGSSGSTITDQAAVYLNASYHLPDDIWFAHWNGCATDLDPAYIPNQYWPNHHRLHQYLGNTTETWGGVTINIDRDFDNGAVAGPGGVAVAGSPTCIGDAIEQKYLAMGGVSSFLGPSVGVVYQVGTGWGQNYANGAIYWSPGTGAHEVHGAILGHYQQLGGPAGALGFPTTDETGTPDTVGRYNHFQYGAMYWTPVTGAHEVLGWICAEWEALGWERSVVGYPITDETATPDGIGRFNHFQSGSIYWTPATGAHEVHGAIRSEWASLGWEHSFLGYPVTDEYTPIAGYRQSNFQHGWIRWNSITRVVSVS